MAEEFYIRNPLRVGMCGDDVRYVQELLNQRGFDLPVTGTFDAETMSAAREVLKDGYLKKYDEWPRELRENEPSSSSFDPDDPGNRGTLDEVFRGDKDAYQQWGLLQESWRFDDKAQFEQYLESTPSPIPDMLYMFDISKLEQGIPGAELPEPVRSSGSGFSELKNTDIPPPESEPYCAVPMSDAGSGSSIGRLALYDEIRQRLPANIGDDRAAEATLSAMRDGITAPEKLQDVVVANDRIFVVGTIPGFRGVVDLNQPAQPANEVETQIAALERQRMSEREQPQPAKSAIVLA